MEKLTLDTFVGGDQDREKKQYLVLHGLKQYREEFSHNRLYPSLAELIRLYEMLKGLVQEKSDFDSLLPQRIKEVDIENRRVVFESNGEEDPALHRALALIDWALPLIKDAIDEGVNIYNFVDEHIVIEEVGLLPVHKEAGYWFVPDVKGARLHLLRFEVTLFSSASERFPTLKTRLIESIEQVLIRKSPEIIKLGLIEKYHDLPNPATYMCDTDLDFPFAETFLPVAKRKLMGRLFS